VLFRRIHIFLDVDGVPGYLPGLLAVAGLLAHLADAARGEGIPGPAVNGFLVSSVIRTILSPVRFPAMAGKAPALPELSR